MLEADWEQVYRRMRSKPVFIKEGRPTSALFKDSRGVSVDRDGGRTLKIIIADEERLHALFIGEMSAEQIKEKGMELRAIVSLTKDQCDSVGACVIPDPIVGVNENHALLQKSETEVRLSKHQAKELAKMATIVKWYE